MEEETILQSLAILFLVLSPRGEQVVGGDCYNAGGLMSTPGSVSILQTVQRGPDDLLPCGVRAGAAYSDCLGPGEKVQNP